MDILRYKNPYTREKDQFKVVRAPSQNSDETTTSIRDNSNGFQMPKLRSEGPTTPTEDVLINFHTTENPLAAETPGLLPVNTVEGHLLSRVTTSGHNVGEPAVTLGDEVEQLNIVDDDVLIRLISNSMFYILRINTISLVVFGLLTLSILWDMAYLYPIGFLWIVDFFELLQMLRHSRKYRNSTQNTRKRLMMIFGPLTKTVSYAGAKGLLLIYLHSSQLIPLYSFLVLPAVYELVSSASAIYKNKQPSIKKMHQVTFAMKALVCILAFSIAFKVEGMMTWQWREVLMSYWVLFSFLCGITVVAGLCLINRCCVFFFADSEQFQVHGVLWIFLILLGKAFLSCSVVVAIRGIYEYSKSTETLVSPFFLIMSYNLVMLLFTLGYYNEIESFFKAVTAVQEETEVTQPPTFETKENQPKILKKIVVPKFLTKSSSTYYRISTDHEIKEVKDKRKKRQDKKNAKSKFKPKELAKGKSPRDQKESAKNPSSKHSRQQKSVDYGSNPKKFASANLSELPSPKGNPDLLITIAETDQDKATLATEIDKKTTFNKIGKAKDFFSSISNRNGVLGIVPSVVRKLAGQKKGKKGYAEHQDNEDDKNKGNLSYDIRANRSAFDFKKDEHCPASMRLKITGRGELRGHGLEELEAKLQALEDRGAGKKSRKDRKTHSMYLNKEQGGTLNLSGVLDIDAPSADSSMVEDSHKGKSGDVSMKQECLICFDKAPDAVFMECGHGGVCYECAVEIWKAAAECYLCRMKIIQVLQIDLKYKDGNVIKVLSSTQMINWENEERE